MKKNRELLEKRITNTCLKIAVNTELCNQIYDDIYDKHNIPKGYIADFICMRMTLSEADDFVLFCIFEALLQNANMQGSLTEFYTDQEIKTYANARRESDAIKFPLRFSMMQVTNDQWIGATILKQLLELRSNQLINYNANTQRALTRVVKGNKEIFKITLNQTTVNEIQNSCEEGTFIPNTITLNIPMDMENDFYYDNEKHELVISKLKNFDILDGFHRQIALYKAFDLNKDFDYSMELRITHWDEAKANTFVYQEAQQTPLKKVDVASRNMNDPANIVVDRLNENTRCNIKGLISRNDGLINYGELAELIRYFYFKDANKTDNYNQTIITLTKGLCKCFNILTEYNLKYLNERYSRKQLAIIIYMFHHFNLQITEEECQRIDEMIERQNELDNRKFTSKAPRKSTINEIEKLYEGVGGHV